MADETLALIIDSGSGITKVGFAGANSPKARFPTLIGMDKATDNPEILIGNNALDKWESLDIYRPIQHGIIRNWSMVESLWRYVFTTELKVSQEEHPVLLTEPPLSPKIQRERCCQLYFESFGVPALYLATTSLLSMYSSANITGVVLDVGEGVAHSVPIHEGCMMPYAITRLDMGGFDLTSHLIKYIEPLKGNTPGDRKIATAIKEKLCYVSLDYEEELKAIEDDPDTHKKEYTLPDGTTISLLKECITCPEMLFTPEIVGRTCPNLSEMCYHSVRMCEPELHRSMFNNIMITGGTSLFNGFLERCEKDIGLLVNGNSSIKVTSPSQRDISVWLGGSVVANLSSFQQMWVTKEEYDEAGPTVIHRKCF